MLMFALVCSAGTSVAVNLTPSFAPYKGPKVALGRSQFASSFKNSFSNAVTAATVVFCTCINLTYSRSYVPAMAADVYSACAAKLANPGGFYAPKVSKEPGVPLVDPCPPDRSPPMCRDTCMLELGGTDVAEVGARMLLWCGRWVREGL